MVIMIFGISNVGKTVVGKRLAQRLKYSFIDLDEEIKKRFQVTLEVFMKTYPFPHERYKVKGAVLNNLINENKENTVIAVSPIYHARNFNSLLDLEDVIALELQDTKEHIFERLLFSDENDNLYVDNEYKEEHKKYYIKDIGEDISYAKRTFKKIKNKYFIDNKSVDQVVDDLIIMIHNLEPKTFVINIGQNILE